VLLYHSLETITIAVKQAAHFAFRRLQKWMLSLLASYIFLWFPVIQGDILCHWNSITL